MIKHIYTVNFKGNHGGGAIRGSEYNLALVPTNAARAHVEPLAAGRSIGGTDDARLILGVVEARRIRSAQGKALNGATRIKVAPAGSRIIQAAGAIRRIIVG